MLCATHAARAALPRAIPSSSSAEESSDGASNVAGSYSVALPDGRIQHVKYTSNGYDGFVADVTYEGTAVYPEEVVAPAPAYHA